MAREATIGLKEIAAEANVSVTTVSRVLASKTPERFPEAARRRVLETAERLRYRPNLLARAARGGKTQTIGVYIPPFDEFWANVIYGVHDALIDADHVPLILWPTHILGGAVPKHSTELAQLHRMTDRAIDGLILWPIVAQDAIEYAGFLATRSLPIVGIDHVATDNPRLVVGTDENMVGRLVAEHLGTLGHRRFIHLAGPAGVLWSTRRKAAFDRSLESLPGAYCVTVPEEEENSLRATLRGLLTGETRFTAIFAATDAHAQTACDVAHEMGLSIPEDLSIVSAGDTGIAQAAGLTSVRQNPYQIGAAAAKLVLDASLGKSEGASVASAEKLFAPELVVRRSTGPAAKNGDGP